MVKRKRIAVAGATVIGMFVLFGPLTIRTRGHLGCCVCRMERTEHSLLGIAFHTDRDNDFAEWYLAHHPRHEHDWRRSGCTVGISAIGWPTYFACGRIHPVAILQPSVLLWYCQQADEATRRAYFEGIQSTDPAVQQQTVDAVNAWFEQWAASHSDVWP